MAIGRTFEESLQKALRMTHPTMEGFSRKLPAGKDFPQKFDMETSLRVPHNTRIHSICKVNLMHFFMLETYLQYLFMLYKLFSYISLL